MMSAPPLPPFAMIRAFEVIGRVRGIRRAADAMDVSHAIVSRHLRALETYVGAVLFDRDAGKLTAIGELYHARLTKAVEEIRLATAEVQRTRDGPMVIGCAPGLAARWLAGRLTEFDFGRAGFTIELRAMDKAPDLSSNTVAGDIRYARRGDRELHTRDISSVELASPAVYPVASPDLARRIAPELRTAEDLLRIPLIEEESDLEWKMWFEAQHVAFVPTRIVARYGHAHLSLAAARSGQGVALANRLLIGDDLQDGRLVPLEGAAVPFNTVSLGKYIFSTHNSFLQNRSIARFKKWLIAETRRELAEP